MIIYRIVGKPDCKKCKGTGEVKTPLWLWLKGRFIERLPANLIRETIHCKCVEYVASGWEKIDE